MPYQHSSSLSETFKKYLLSLLIVSFSIFVGLLLSEFVLNLYIPSSTQKIQIITANPFGSGSYRNKKNHIEIFELEGMKGKIATNSFGMNWHEVSLSKPDNKKRLAFLGDSFTFGCWTSDNSSSFAGVFESLGNDSLEILNFGVSGYGLEDMRMLLEGEALAFKPDYVFLAIFNGNDFRDTWLGVDKYMFEDGILNWNWPNMEEKVPQEFCAEPPPAIKHGLWEDSKIAQLLKAALKTQEQENIQTNSSILQRIDPGKLFTSYEFWSAKNYPSVARKAVDKTLSEMERILSICSENGIQLLVASLPYKAQVRVVEMQGELYDIKRPQSFVEDFCKAKGIPYIDLLMPMRHHFHEKKLNLFYESDPHFNQKGHQIAGAELRRFFDEWQALDR